MQYDKAAELAMAARVKPSWGAQIADAWDDQPRILRIVISIGGLAVFLVGLWFEGNSSGRGWMRIGEGSAWPPLMWIMGFSATIGAIWMHRVMREEQRDKKDYRIAAAAMIAGMVLSLSGVIANMVDLTETNSSSAYSLSTEKSDIESRVRVLRARVAGFDEAMVRSALESDQRAHAAYLAEAKGWGMSDLDPDGACAADLRLRQRQLCNDVNGPDGLLASIAMASAALESHEAAKAALVVEEQRLAEISGQRTVNFWNAIGATLYPDNPRAAQTMRVWGAIALSVIVMIFLMLLSDAILEFRERRLARKQEVL